MFEFQDQVCALLWLIVAIIAVIPLIAFTIAYKRIKTTKLFVTLIAFGIFVIKGITLGMKMFLPNYSDEFWWSLAAILDITIVGLITFSLMIKK